MGAEVRGVGAVALTGRRLEPEDASLDHLIALARHGSNTMENVQIVCNHVNAAKGTMSNEEFIQMCREVAEWTRR